MILEGVVQLRRQPPQLIQPDQARPREFIRQCGICLESFEKLFNMRDPRLNPLTPKEHELLRGMCNCYSACEDDFENTVRMVANARDMDPDAVKATLLEIANKYSDTQEYRALRSRLPAEFPF